MHYVIVPESVILLDIMTGAPMVEEVILANGNRIQTDKLRKPMTLFQLICDMAFTDAPVFGAGRKAATLEDDHLERLRKSLLEERDNRYVVYDPRVLMQVQPLLKALKEAMTEEDYKKWREKNPAPAEE